LITFRGIRNCGCLAISPDGRTFAVHAAQSALALYATSSLQRVGEISLAHGETVRAAAWGGPRLVLGTDHEGVELYKVRGTPSLVRALHGLESLGRHPARSLATTDGGRLVAAVDGYKGPRPKSGGPHPEEGAPAVWRHGRLVGGKRVDLHTFGNGVAFSADASLLAVATDDGRVLAPDPTTDRIERTIRPQTGALSVAFAADGKLATGSHAGIVDLWKRRPAEPRPRSQRWPVRRHLLNRPVVAVWILEEHERVVGAAVTKMDDLADLDTTGEELAACGGDVDHTELHLS
jgi:WD40 repeat protein